MIVVARSGSDMRQMTAPEIADDLAARINAGRYAPGTRLSYAVIAAEYGVSREKIKRAMALLRDRGLVDYWPGLGVHVR